MKKDEIKARSFALSKGVASRARTIFILLIIACLFGYGWRKTEIEPWELVRDFHLVKPLIKALLNPDLITKNKKMVSVEALFYLGQLPTKLEMKNKKSFRGVIRLSKPWGNIGDLLVVRGEGLESGREGGLFWVNSIDQKILLSSIQTDQEGRFQTEIRVPQIARGDWQTVRATLIWNSGGWHFSKTLSLAGQKMVETIFLALMATTMAAFIAFPLGFFGARNLMMGRPLGKVLYYVVRTSFNFLRSIEPLVLAILFAVWVGIGPFAGVLALGVHSTAALGKLYSEQIESVETGPLDAISSTGATPLQVVLYGVVPQVISQFLAFTFYRWDINVRMSTIIGFVGGGGIGFLLQQWINLLQYRKAGTALLLIIIVVISLDFFSAQVRNRIR